MALAQTLAKPQPLRLVLPPPLVEIKARRMGSLASALQAEGFDPGCYEHKKVERNGEYFYRHYDLHGNPREIKITVDVADHNRHTIPEEDIDRIVQDQVIKRHYYCGFTEIRQIIASQIDCDPNEIFGRTFVRERVRSETTFRNKKEVKRLFLYYPSIADGTEVKMPVIWDGHEYLLAVKHAARIVVDEVAKRKDFCDVARLAEICGVTRRTIFNWCERDRVKAIRCGKSSYIKWEDAARWTEVAVPKKVALPDHPICFGELKRQFGITQSVFEKGLSEDKNWFEYDAIEDDRVVAKRVGVYLGPDKRYYTDASGEAQLAADKKTEREWWDERKLAKKLKISVRTLQDYRDSEFGGYVIPIGRDGIRVEVAYVVLRHRVLLHPEDCKQAVQTKVSKPIIEPQHQDQRPDGIANLLPDVELDMKLAAVAALRPNIDREQKRLHLSEWVNIGCRTGVRMSEEYYVGVPFKESNSKLTVNATDWELVQFRFELPLETPRVLDTLEMIGMKMRQGGTLTDMEKAMIRIARFLYMQGQKGRVEKFLMRFGKRIEQYEIGITERTEKYYVAARG